MAKDAEMAWDRSAIANDQVNALLGRAIRALDALGNGVEAGMRPFPMVLRGSSLRLFQSVPHPEAALDSAFGDGWGARAVASAVNAALDRLFLSMADEPQDPRRPVDRLYMADFRSNTSANRHGLQGCTDDWRMSASARCRFRSRCLFDSFENADLDALWHAAVDLHFGLVSTALVVSHVPVPRSLGAPGQSAIVALLLGSGVDSADASGFDVRLERISGESERAATTREDRLRQFDGACISLGLTLAADRLTSEDRSCDALVLPLLGPGARVCNGRDGEGLVWASGSPPIRCHVLRRRHAQRPGDLRARDIMSVVAELIVQVTGYAVLDVTDGEEADKRLVVDSLMALELSDRFLSVFGVRVPVEQLLDRPSASQLLRRVRAWISDAREEPSFRPIGRMRTVEGML